MTSFRDKSIRQKIIFIIMLTTFITLLIVFIAFMIYELSTFRKKMVDDVATLAMVIGDNSKAALAFSDQDAAEETLTTLRNEQNIVAATIFTKEGKIFATYPPGVKPSDIFRKPLGRNFYFDKEYLHLFKPITLLHTIF